MLPDAPGRLIASLALVAAALAQPGCYYLQLAAGQLEMNRRKVPIEELRAREDTEATLRGQLDHASRAREFAVTSLGLPDNGSYRAYADLDRPYATWNVFAAPEFSVEPRRWCFPVAGCVSYRGYFDERRAGRVAARLSGRGNDVYVAPSIAYSTLGHLQDPLLNTMLRYGDAELAALLFHELAHQAVYVPGDSDFNEAFATVVEFEGARRWFSHLGRADELAAFLESRRRQQRAAESMIAGRERLAAIYGRQLPVAEMRIAKAAELDQLRQLLAAEGPGPEGELNNARLAAVATYHRCVPALSALLATRDGDLPSFYGAIRALARDDAARSALCPRH